MDEKDVIAGLHNSDPVAFETIYEMFQPDILYTLRVKYKNCEENIEDIVIETFTALWKKPPKKIKSFEHLRNHLRVAAANRCKNFIRKKNIIAKHTAALSYMLTYQQVSMEEKMRIEFYISYIHSFFDKLPPRCKEVVILRGYGLSDKDIADKLGISVANVQDKKSKAKQLLIEMIGNKSPDDPDWLSFLTLVVVGLIGLNQVSSF